MAAPQFKKSVSPNEVQVSENELFEELHHTVSHLPSDEKESPSHPETQKRNLDWMVDIAKRNGISFSPAERQRLMQKHFQYWSDYRLNAAKVMSEGQSDPVQVMDAAIDEISILAKSLNIQWDSSRSLFLRTNAVQQGIDVLFLEAEIQAFQGNEDRLLEGLKTYAQFHSIELNEERLALLKQIARIQKVCDLAEPILLKEQELESLEKSVVLVAIRPEVQAVLNQKRKIIQQEWAKVTEVDAENSLKLQVGKSVALQYLKRQKNLMHELLAVYLHKPELKERVEKQIPTYQKPTFEALVEEMRFLNVQRQHEYLRLVDEMTDCMLQGKSFEKLSQLRDLESINPYIKAQDALSSKSLEPQKDFDRKNSLEVRTAQKDVLEEIYRRQTGMIDPQNFTYYNMGELAVEDWSQDGVLDLNQDILKNGEGKVIHADSAEATSLMKELGVSSLQGLNLKHASVFLFYKHQLEYMVSFNDLSMPKKKELLEKLAQRYHYQIPEKFWDDLKSKQVQRELNQLLGRQLNDAFDYTTSPLNGDLTPILEFAQENHIKIDEEVLVERTEKQKLKTLELEYLELGQLLNRIESGNDAGALFQLGQKIESAEKQELLNQDPKRLEVFKRYFQLKQVGLQLSKIQEKLPKRPTQSRVVKDNDFFSWKKDHEEWKAAQKALPETLRELEVFDQKIKEDFGVDTKRLKLEIALCVLEIKALQGKDSNDRFREIDYLVYLPRAEKEAKEIGETIPQSRIDHFERIFLTAQVKHLMQFEIPRLAHSGDVANLQKSFQAVEEISKNVKGEDVDHILKDFSSTKAKYLRIAKLNRIEKLWLEISDQAHQEKYLHPFVKIKSELVQLHRELGLDWQEAHYQVREQSRLYAIFHLVDEPSMDDSSSFQKAGLPGDFIFNLHKEFHEYLSSVTFVSSMGGGRSSLFQYSPSMQNRRTVINIK
ncbi:MAG: hypothetical protein JNK65_03475 [Deltaproteobacteria bacterium]|nr:hypothetical protein [Deltaproteobacteria bacterium]